MVQHILVHNQFAAKIFTKQGLGNIVGCRTQATCDDDDLRNLPLLIERLPDIVVHIADSYAPFYPNADLIQFLCNKSAVGIDGLANEQFIADSDDGCINCIQVRKFESKYLSEKL